MPAVATFILQSKECSILLWKGVREPLTHPRTDIRISKEVCVLNHAITVLYGSVSFWAILSARCIKKR